MYVSETGHVDPKAHAVPVTVPLGGAYQRRLIAMVPAPRLTHVPSILHNTALLPRLYPASY